MEKTQAEYVVDSRLDKHKIKFIDTLVYLEACSECKRHLALINAGYGDISAMLCDIDRIILGR